MVFAYGGGSTNQKEAMEGSHEAAIKGTEKQ